MLSWVTYFQTVPNIPPRGMYNRTPLALGCPRVSICMPLYSILHLLILHSHCSNDSNIPFLYRYTENHDCIINVSLTSLYGNVADDADPGLFLQIFQSAFTVAAACAVHLQSRRHYSPETVHLWSQRKHSSVLLPISFMGPVCLENGISLQLSMRETI